MLIYPHGQLTQLGECLLDVEKVRGSSPLLPTKVSQAHATACAFLFYFGDNNACISEQQSEIKREDTTIVVYLANDWATSSEAKI